MPMEEKVYIVYNYLNKGKENAVTLTELKNRTGYSRRVITTCMQVLRKSGIPVCSCNSKPGGYFIAKNKEEIIEYIKRLQTIATGLIDTMSYLVDIEFKG